MINGLKKNFLTSKIKFLAFLFIATFLAISSSKPKHKLAPVVTNCPLLLPIENYSQTVIFDIDIFDHAELKTCILQNYLSKHSVLLVNTDVDIRVNVTQDLIRTSNNPNIIIITKYFTPKMFDSTLWKLFVRSNWSLLYIIVTGDSTFKCNNGTMNSNDILLLDNIMNTLWHRFRIMRVGVLFPLTCKQKMVIYNGKRRSTGILYDRSIQLINATNSKEIFAALQKSGEKLSYDYPMLAGLFYRYPTAMKDCENLRFYMHFNLNLTLGYCGLDGIITHDILSHLKFNVSFSHDENCNYYGFGIHGNVSGALGCVIRNELDVSFNSRFMALNSEEQMYYLHYVRTDTLCALVRKPDVIPLWHGVYNLFSPPLWVLISAVLVAIGGIMWATATINKTMTGPETMTFWLYLHNSVTTTMIGYSPMKTRTLLMIRSACLLGSILILAVYQGHISRVYTTVERFQSIKSLKDLYNSKAALYTSPSMRNFLLRHVQNPEDKLQEEFFNRARLTIGDRLGEILKHSCAATVDRKSDAEMSILEQYSDDHGTPLIDIVDECFYTYYLSYIARTGFPFVEDLRIVTERLNEAGLPNIYYRWTQQMLEIPNSIPENDSEPRPFSKIKLKDQCVAFGILFFGTIVSVIVFAAEIWIGRRQQLKRCQRRS